MDTKLQFLWSASQSFSGMSRNDDCVTSEKSSCEGAELQHLLTKIQKLLSLYTLMLSSYQTLRLKDPANCLFHFTFAESLPEDQK